MKAAELLDRVISLPNAGIFTDEQRMNEKYIYSIINSYRASVCRLRFKETGNIDGDYLQKYYLEYNKKIQESNRFVKFLCAGAISVSGEEDGFVYIGTVPEGNTSSIAWQRINTRPALSTYTKHGVMNILLKRNVSVLWDQHSGSMEVYGNMDIRNGLVEAVFHDPFEIPTWNKEVDDYPMPIDDITLMESMILKENTSIIKNQKPDLISNSNDVETIKK